VETVSRMYSFNDKSTCTLFASHRLADQSLPATTHRSMRFTKGLTAPDEIRVRLHNDSRPL
jgi:hypothetical protein